MVMLPLVARQVAAEEQLVDVVAEMLAQLRRLQRSLTLRWSITLGATPLQLRVHQQPTAMPLWLTRFFNGSIRQRYQREKWWMNKRVI
jgi:hypothetical protein